ncbi:MAG: chromosomal replication initiator protein DnaA [Bdellovibrionota bacterium]|jgi:chromosomal replication initiator protein
MKGSSISLALDLSAPSWPAQCWEMGLAVLKAELDPQIFAAYIQPLKFSSYDEKTFECTVLAPSKLVCRHVIDNFKDKITQALSAQSGIPDLVINFTVDDSATLFDSNTRTSPYVVVKRYKAKEDSKPIVNPTPLTIDPKYTFDNFVVGNSNQFCHAAAMRVAEAPGCHYNPLFIYSGVGLGKTHLLHAIGNAVLKKNPSAKVLYTSSEAFTNELIQSLRLGTMELFKNKMRGMDLLLIDDIQFLCGKERTQEEFFHTFNALYGAKHQIVITSDKLPQEIPDLEERLRTRFSWGLTADLQAPDFETRMAILNRKAAVDGFTLPINVSALIAERISSNVRELEGALTRLNAVSSLRNVPITEDLAYSALRDLLEPKYINLSVDDIKKAVCTHFNLKVSDLVSKRRTRNIAYPRHIAMFLCRKHTPASYPEIGSKFGGRDHSSVIHATNVISTKIQSDHETKTAVEGIEKALLGVR